MIVMRTPRRDGGRTVFPRRARSDERSRLDQSIFPQSRSPFPLLSLTASAYGEMLRKLVLLAILAFVASACSQNQAAATPSPTLGCPEPTRTVSVQSPFDDDNRASWRKELAAGGKCDAVTAAYVKRLEDEKELQLFANASQFAMIGRVTDATSGAAVEQVCITPGKPGSICWSRTDKDGWYLLDLGAVFAKEGFFEIFFVKSGYPEQHSVSRMLSGRARIDYQMTK
jgi:hypothetical protein